MNGNNHEDYNRQLAVQPLDRLKRQPLPVAWLDTGHQLPAEDQRAGLARWLEEPLK